MLEIIRTSNCLQVINKCYDVNNFLTISFIFAVFTYMKIQRLSALDIGILTTELGKWLQESTIGSIALTGQRLIFKTNKGDFVFVIISGNPYVIRDCAPASGSLRFRNLIGGKIDNINQVNDDRIIRLKVVAFNKLGLRKEYNLYFELYANGNVILTDETDIIREIYRGAANRQIGKKYKLPESSNQSFIKLLRDNDYPPDLSQRLEKLNILPFNLIENANVKLAESLKKAIDHPQPHLLKDSGGSPCGFTIAGPPFIESISGEKKETLIDAISEYVASLYGSEGKRRDTDNPQTALKKAQSKLKAIRDELAQTENAALYRQYGDIILANLGKITKGMKNFRCGNPYSLSDDFIEIPLTPSLTPEKNAALYFDKARKMESSIEILKRRLINQQHKIDELLLNQNSPVLNRQDDTRSTVSEKTSIKIPFRQVDLADGWRVYIGKSAESNDELTFSFAKKDDYWFHAWQAAGSHVVLRRPNKGDIPPKEFLIRAAELAAYNSKAKTSSKVPVIYTEARYVRKVKGVAGKVIVTNEKQLMVKPIGPDKSTRH
jgi:predicted ribosome quality control (RQC) complex YloA/Tae2 family protein